MNSLNSECSHVLHLSLRQALWLLPQQPSLRIPYRPGGTSTRVSRCRRRPEDIPPSPPRNTSLTLRTKGKNIYFKPQPIFRLIQETASEVRGALTHEEMLKTFNMGWGFAVVADKGDADGVIASLEKSQVKAEQIGTATDTGKIVASYKGERIELR